MEHPKSQPTLCFNIFHEHCQCDASRFPTNLIHLMIFGLLSTISVTVRGDGGGGAVAAEHDSAGPYKRDSVTSPTDYSTSSHHGYLLHTYNTYLSYITFQANR